MSVESPTPTTVIVIIIRTLKTALVETLELDLAVAQEFHGADDADDATAGALATWWS